MLDHLAVRLRSGPTDRLVTLLPVDDLEHVRGPPDGGERLVPDGVAGFLELTDVRPQQRVVGLAA